MGGVTCGMCGGPWFPHCGCLWQCAPPLDYRPQSDGSYVDGTGKRRGRPKPPKELA